MHRVSEEDTERKRKREWRRLVYGLLHFGSIQTMFCRVFRPKHQHSTPEKWLIVMLLRLSPYFNKFSQTKQRRSNTTTDTLSMNQYGSDGHFAPLAIQTLIHTHLMDTFTLHCSLSISLSFALMPINHLNYFIIKIIGPIFHLISIHGVWDLLMFIFFGAMNYCIFVCNL